MRHIAVLYSGHAAHFRTFTEPKFAQYIQTLIYMPDFTEDLLANIDVLIVPSQLHLPSFIEIVPAIHRFAARGGTVVAFGPQPEQWLPHQHWELRETNFWWWLEEGADSGLRLAAPEHSLFKNGYLTVEACTWHQHGVFHLQPGMTSLIDMKDGGSLFYIDTVSTNGTWIVTTLDPDFHFGAYFMPATETFLAGFFPWLAFGQFHQ